MNGSCCYMFTRYCAGLILLILLGHPIEGFAQSVLQNGCQQSSLILMGKRDSTDFLFKMGESIRIKIKDGCVDVIKAQLAKTEASRGIKLLLDTVSMTNLPMGVLESPSDKELTLTFDLVRRPQDDDNRKAWDVLLGKQHGAYEFSATVAIAVGTDTAWSIQSASPFRLRLANSEAVWGTLAVGTVLFLMIYARLVKDPNALRDAPNGHYSLGKSQMAFWGLLIVLSFTGIWFLTGTMERIPPHVLILMGISGATGLSAVVIGETRKSGGRQELQAQLALLREKRQTLEQAKLAAGAGWSPDNETGLRELVSNIQAKESEAARTPSSSSRGFWQDICDDGNGVSFHRMQVVIWTIVLGVIFVNAVSQVMSMPEFPETLLVLQGISNGTYLGFKIPEKT